MTSPDSKKPLPVDDLPRIGEEPDCDFPGCQLLGRYLHISRATGNQWITCSIHDDWKGPR